MYACELFSEATFQELGSKENLSIATERVIQMKREKQRTEILRIFLGSPYPFFHHFRSRVKAGYISAFGFCESSFILSAYNCAQ